MGICKWIFWGYWDMIFFILVLDDYFVLGLKDNFCKSMVIFK